MNPYNQNEPKEEQIRSMFNKIAPHYDLLNRILSMGIDASWRRKAVRIVRQTKPLRVLDVATGTGDMAIAMAKAMPEVLVHGMDISSKMIEVGLRKIKRKGLDKRVTMSVGNVNAIRITDGSADAVTVAFGVRNFEDMNKAIREMYRVLRHGGILVILEFSTPKPGIVSVPYRLYFHKILPVLGGLISKDKKAYRYLPWSVDEFPCPEKFLDILRSTGLRNCVAKPLSGGIAYMYVGVK